MTETTRCPYSDLPTTQCDHCHTGLPPRERQPTFTLQCEEMPPRAHMRVVYPIAYQEPTPNRPAIVLLADTPETLHDYVTELVDPTTHLQRRELAQTNPDGTTTFVTINHRTTSVSLIDQLDTAVSTTGAQDGGAHSFASKPAANIATVDALQRIEKGTYQWLKTLGVKDAGDTYPDLRDAIRQVRAQAADMNACHRVFGTRDEKARWCCSYHELAAEIRSWWAQARVLSGWDSPAWKPDNTCPLCGVKGGLRVKLEAQSAVCCECGETWSPDRLGLLVEHVRLENREDQPAEEDMADEVEAG